MKKLILLFAILAAGVAQAQQEITYFTADWCAPCKQYGPILKEVVKEEGWKLTEIDLTDPTKEQFTKYFPGGQINLPATSRIVEGETIKTTGAPSPMNKVAIRKQLGLKKVKYEHKPPVFKQRGFGNTNHNAPGHVCDETCHK